MKALDYKDVSLVSRQVSTISSRDEIDTSVEFMGHTLTSPIVSSPMLDVSDGLLVKTMIDNGGYGFVHRFCPIAQQVQEFNVTENGGCAIGINGDWLDRFKALHQAGCRAFCLDVALGAHSNVENAIKTVYEIDNSVKLLVGNVASKEGYNFLSKQYGVSSVRCGIAGGKSCSTKNKTGIYYPMFSLLMEISEHRTYPEVTIMSDGGIKEPGDMCKSIFAGADVVMLGSVLSNTKESPATKIRIDNKWYTEYRGSASFEVQKTYKDIPKYIEGKTSLIEYESKTIKETIQNFMDGLRSSMSYANARNLSEYRTNIEYLSI